MEVKETRQVSKTYVTDIVCNKCGESCTPESGWAEYSSGWASWGYGSSKDGTNETWHMCEKCTDALVETFLIEPESN